MKKAIGPTAFLAAFIASANIRPPPCNGCLIPQVDGVTFEKIRISKVETATDLAISGAVHAAADAGN